MDSTYERDDERHVLRVTATGPFDSASVMALAERMRREDTWSYSLLYDLRGVTTVPTAADVAAITAAVAAGSIETPRGPLALVAREGELYRRACAYFALGAQRGRRIRVFRYLDEAEEWLGSPDA